MSNITQSTNTESSETFTIPEDSPSFSMEIEKGEWGWAVCDKLTREAMSRTGNMKNLIFNYDFVNYLDEETKETFFLSFGPNWAYHIINITDVNKVMEDMYEPDDDPDELIAAFVTENVNIYCNGDVRSNRDTLLALYFWRPDVRAKHWLEENPDHTYQEALDFVTDPLICKSGKQPFQEKIYNWYLKAKSAYEKYHKIAQCSNCGGSPPRPSLKRETAARSSPLLTWQEIYPVRLRCCGQETYCYMSYQ